MNGNQNVHHCVSFVNLLSASKRIQAAPLPHPLTKLVSRKLFWLVSFPGFVKNHIRTVVKKQQQPKHHSVVSGGAEGLGALWPGWGSGMGRGRGPMGPHTPHGSPWEPAYSSSQGQSDYNMRAHCEHRVAGRQGSAAQPESPYQRFESGWDRGDEGGGWGRGHGGGGRGAGGWDTGPSYRGTRGWK